MGGAFVLKKGPNTEKLHSTVWPAGATRVSCKKTEKRLALNKGRSLKSTPSQTGSEVSVCLNYQEKIQPRETKRPLFLIWSHVESKMAIKLWVWPITAHLRYRPHVQIWNLRISKQNHQWVTLTVTVTNPFGQPVRMELPFRTLCRGCSADGAPWCLMVLLCLQSSTWASTDETLPEPTTASSSSGPTTPRP